MITTLSEKNQIANKDYSCMACDWINNSWGNVDFTMSELRLIVKARRNEYKIKKGEDYLRQSNKCDGRFYEFVAIPEIHDICLRHDIYDS